MRAKDSADGLQLAAIAGSYVTLLGMDMDRSDCQGLLGFAVHRKDHTSGQSEYMRGQRAFRSSLTNAEQRTYSTRHHPIQGFWWADYTAKPGHDYTYTVSALTGAVAAPEIAAAVSVSVQNERPHNGVHDIYFNRGVAASQQYAEEFHNKPPNRVDGDPDRVWTWLSRGLYEALCEYVRDTGPGTALRIAAYEFNYVPFLQEVAAALARGVDVQIIYDRRDPDVYTKTEAALQATGLSASHIAIRRSTNSSYIAHNKFIVKLVDGSAQSVWTGGTNFSEGGIFGHSNVAQVVNDKEIAAEYLSYWQALQPDPTNPVLSKELEAISAPPASAPAEGAIAIFSPRSSLAALDWYAARAKAAQQALFMTFAFGMDTRFQDAYEHSSAPLRLALMEKLVADGLRGTNRVTAIRRMRKLRAMPENTFAVGGLIKGNALDGWLQEKLSGLNGHVKWVHNKFMLVDPLSSDPLVVNGSANFSQKSTTQNDENMLIVRGDLRSADIFFTEFLRLHRHHAWREQQQWRNKAVSKTQEALKGVAQVVRKPRQILALIRRDINRWLVEPGDDEWPWWSTYFDDFANSTRRSYFANPYVP